MRLGLDRLRFVALDMMVLRELKGFSSRLLMFCFVSGFFRFVCRLCFVFGFVLVMFRFMGSCCLCFGSVLDRRHFFFSLLGDTLYPWTGLLSKFVLVGTHVCRLLRDRSRAALFLSCTLETETKLVPLWKTAGFRRKIRLPSNTNNVKIRSKRGTLYFWTGLPIISLLLTCVDCFEIEEEQLYSFQARRRMRPSSCLAGKPWFST